MPKKPIKKSETIPRVRKLIETTGKPIELFTTISDTNEAIKASNDAKINYRTISKIKDVDKAELRSAKKAMDSLIKKEDAARIKVDTSLKQLQVQGFVTEHLDNLAVKLFKHPEKMWEPSVLNSFKSLYNPTTSTAYSPLNVMILSSFMEKNGITNPRFITRSRAKKMFGNEVTLDQNDKEIPTAYVVALKKDLLLNVFEKDKDGNLKIDASGKPIKKLDSNGDPIVYRRKAYGFAPPLVNIEQLRNHPDIPKEWLTKNHIAPTVPDDEFIRKLINLVKDDISPVPVKIDPKTTHSYCNKQELVLSDTYRNPLVEFCSLSHEVMHLSGYYNLTDSSLKQPEEQRESIVKYNDSKNFRATEELTVQVAMMQFIQSFNLKNLDETIFEATMANHDIYNQGWASCLSKGEKSDLAFDKFKESLLVVLTESAKALRDFVDVAVIKVAQDPALQAEIAEKLGDGNVISLKINANKISAEAEVLKNERQIAYKAQKVKM